MKPFWLYAFLTPFLLNTAVVRGMEIKFEGDLDKFTRQIRRIKPNDEISLVITASAEFIDSEEKFTPFFEEIKKVRQNVTTLKITKSPPCVVNTLIDEIQEEPTFFSNLTVLDLSENESAKESSVTFSGLEGLLEKTPIQELNLSHNSFSETMDPVLERILSSRKNALKTLNLSKTDPTPQTLSCIVRSLMMNTRKEPLNLILDNNDFSSNRLNFIESLLVPNQITVGELHLKNCYLSRYFEDFYLTQQLDAHSIIEYYLVQGSCTHLLLWPLSARSSGSFQKLLGKVVSLWGNCTQKESRDPMIALGFLERLKTLLHDNFLDSSHRKYTSFRDFLREEEMEEEWRIEEHLGSFKEKMFELGRAETVQCLRVWSPREEEEWREREQWKELESSRKKEEWKARREKKREQWEKESKNAPLLRGIEKYLNNLETKTFPEAEQKRVKDLEIFFRP